MVDLNQGKTQWDLINLEIIDEVAAILTEGRKTHPTFWYEEPGAEEGYEASLMRHMVAVQKDPNSRDEKTGRLHKAHVLSNAYILCDLAWRGYGL